MKLLVLGAKGMLGSHLCALSTFPIISFDRFELDITDLDSLERCVLSLGATHVINCSGYTKVDQAEDEPSLAYAVNVIGVKNLGILSNRHKIEILHVSTDYVFDGSSQLPYKENAPTSPLNVYGATKLCGEEVLLNETERACIVRTSWLFGNFGNHFVRTMIYLMQQRECLKVVFDQIGRPTYAKDLAKVLMQLVNERGIYHFCNLNQTSWFEFAEEIFRLGPILGYQWKTKKIDPIFSFEYPTKAKRPLFSVLSTEKIQNHLNFSPRSWKEALKECMENEKIARI